MTHPVDDVRGDVNGGEEEQEHRGEGQQVESRAQQGQQQHPGHPHPPQVRVQSDPLPSLLIGRQVLSSLPPQEIYKRLSLPHVFSLYVPLPKVLLSHYWCCCCGARWALTTLLWCQKGCWALMFCGGQVLLGTAGVGGCPALVESTGGAVGGKCCWVLLVSAAVLSAVWSQANCLVGEMNAWRERQRWGENGTGQSRPATLADYYSTQDIL